MKIVFVLSACAVCACAARAADTAAIYAPFEIPVPLPQAAAANVWEYPVEAVFSAPSGKRDTLGGFYHSRDLWMVRFAPDEPGAWSYKITYGGNSLDGSFVCVPSAGRGFIRKQPGNPKRLVYSDGGVWSGVGFDDCIGPRDSILETAGMDGGFRPAGTKYNKGWEVPYAQYLLAYGDAAGFSLYRYSDANCQYSIIASIAANGNSYDTLHSLWTDTLFDALRAHGFRIFMTIMSSPRGNSSDSASMAAVERYAQYCINRYGALVDFWELTNESNPDSLWIADVANYIHAHDPYRHLVSMSNPAPAHPSVDIISPHWYGKEADNASDLATQQQINAYAAYPKPVIFGEQGDGKWDSSSAMRLRGRIWSAFFNQGVIDFWNTSWTKECCNQYIGWESRRYVRALQNFTSLIDSGARIVQVAVAPADSVRAYGLRSPLMEAAYIRNSRDEKVRTTGVQVTVDAPVNGVATWYDPRTGHIVASQAVATGEQTLPAPDFIADIALFVGSSVPPFPDLFTVDVSTRTHEFFNVPIGDADSLTIYVSNNGAQNVTIDSALIYGIGAQYFSVRHAPLPAALAPGDSIPFVAAYAPTAIDTSPVMLSIAHSGSPAWENVALIGDAVYGSGVVGAPGGAVASIFACPDPFRATVSLRLSLPRGVRSLAIYNAFGERVADLTAAARRTGAVVFDGGALPAGMYFCRMESEGKIAVKPLALVR